MTSSPSSKIQLNWKRYSIFIRQPFPQADGESEDDGVGPLDPYLTDNSLSAEDLNALQHLADATRLAARIADTPTNFMNVRTFIEVSELG